MQSFEFKKEIQQNMAQRNWTQAQNEAITSYGQDILVSAAAGSGKTATLTERVIRAVVGEDGGRAPTDISKMLIVTFTRAAAAELRDRISDALEKAIAENPSDRRLFRQLALLPSAHISTIDSFYSEPVRANFERLGLNANFRIADEAELDNLNLEIMGEVIERFYDRYGNDPASNRFVFFMENFINAKDEASVSTDFIKLYKKLKNYPEGIEILRHNEDMLRQGSKRDFFETEYGKVILSDINDYINYAEAAMSEAVGTVTLDETLSKAFLEAFEYDYNFCRALKNILGKNSYAEAGAFALTYEKKTLNRLPKGAKNEQTELLRNRRKKITDYLEKLRNSVFVAEPAQICEDMLNCADIVHMMYELMSEFDRCVTDEKTRLNILGFSDVRDCMLKLLTDGNGNPTDIALAYREQFDSIYIDEYQDVDEIQDLIFKTVGNGHNRFMVGDIKQSIYGFRGAEPLIFAKYRRLFSDGSDGKSVFMANNFRCSEKIIDFTNLVCSFIFGACESSIGYCKDDDLVFSKQEPDGYISAQVQVVIVNNPKSKDKTDADTVEGEDTADEDSSPDTEDDSNESEISEAVWVADEIVSILRNREKKANGEEIRPSDIAVITRNAACGAEIAAKLEKRGIETDCPTQKDIMHGKEMTGLLNFLRSVSNPQYDISLSCALNSAMCGFSLDEIVKIRSCADQTYSLYDAMENCSKEDSELGKKCFDFIEMHSEYRRLSAKLPVSRLLRLIFRDKRLFTDPSSEASLVLYEKAVKYDKYSYSGLVGFVKQMDIAMRQKPKATLTGDSSDAVTVLTVHNSKGLEFPVCFVCGCDSGFNMKDTSESILFDRNLGTGFYIDCKGGVEKHDTPMRKAISSVIAKRTVEEEMRILYVALTRARERLYVTCETKNQTTLLSAASVCSEGFRANILGAKNFISWILAAILHNGYSLTKENENAPFCIKQIYAPRMCDDSDTHETQSDQTISDGDCSDTSSAVNRMPPLNDGAANKNSDLFDADTYINSVLEGQRNFVYPYAILSELPSKMTVTGLQAELFTDSNNEEAAQISELQRMIHDMSDITQSPAKKEGKGHISAAQRGTATHELLQFCDFEYLALHGAEAEIERQVCLNFIDRHTADIIPLDFVQKFADSSLFREIRNAENIRREFRFSMFPSASDFVSDKELASKLGNAKIQIQGAIDLIIEQRNGDIILCDYKTDHLTERELSDASLIKKKMNAAHGIQLSYYAKAIGQIYGRAPKAVLIYSVPFGDTVEIDALKNI